MPSIHRPSARAEFRASAGAKRRRADDVDQPTKRRRTDVVSRTKLPLPDELTLEVMDYLSPRDRLAPVSKDWAALARDRFRWRAYIAVAGWRLPHSSIPSHSVDWEAQYRAQRDLHDLRRFSQKKALYVRFGLERLKQDAERFPPTLPELNVRDVPSPEMLAWLVDRYPNLRHLNFESGKPLTAAHIESFAKLPHLESLRFYLSFHAMLTPETARLLAHAAPKLRHLSLIAGKISTETLAALCDLKFLERLDLSHDEHIDALPAEIANLTNLKELHLRGGLAPPGTYPTDDNIRSAALHQHIADWLPQLEVLDLSCRRLADASVLLPLAQLPKLRDLRLRRTTITTIPGELCTPQLRRLDVSANPGFTFPDATQHMTGLQDLDASECDFSSVPDAICELRTLTKLDLHYNYGMGFPERLPMLAGVRELTLFGCGLDTLPRAVCDMTALTRLNAWGNRLRGLPKEFDRLQSLTHVDIAHSNFRAVPRSLAKIPSIKWLHMADIKNKHLPRLAGLFPKLEYFGTSEPYRTKDAAAHRQLRRVLAGSQHLRAVTFDYNTQKENHPPLGPQVKVLDGTDFRHTWEHS